MGPRTSWGEQDSKLWSPTQGACPPLAAPGGPDASRPQGACPGVCRWPSECPGSRVPSAPSSFVRKATGPRPQAEPGRTRMQMTEGGSEDWGSLPRRSPREPPFSCQTLTGAPRRPAPAAPTPGSPRPGRGSSSRSPRPRGGLKPSSLERHPAALLVPFSSHAGALAVRQDSPKASPGAPPQAGLCPSSICLHSIQGSKASPC